jgi:hypothetical protein
MLLYTLSRVFLLLMRLQVFAGCYVGRKKRITNLLVAILPYSVGISPA